MATENDRDGERAFEPLQGSGGRFLRTQILAQEIGHQMGYDLRIGLGAHLVATGGEFLAQLPEILDDAVMDDGRHVGRVRMGVDFVRDAVGGPARVADADLAGQRILIEQVSEIGELALGAAALDMAVHQRRDAR